MRFSVLAAAGLIGAATAAPAPGPTALNWDDVIVVLSDGSTQIMNAAKYDAIEARAVLPPVLADRRTDRVGDGIGAIARRDGCEQSTEAQILSDEEFVGPDVAISPVVSSTGAIADVSVANGYNIENSVTVEAGIEVSAAEKVLGYSLSISYGQSWTTTETQTLRFTMQANQYGLVVSQPNVRRVTGNMITGCTDKPDVSPFTSDSYSSQSYGNLAWVKGVIRLCNSTVYPVPYCVGKGEHR
ncbi:hypothetical protein ColTof4_03921 [Colletotrichum tofieldiae]|uniref:Celp0028 effector like protein n=1 Tax=Colletotrichum tofieldiae TaxID=708197 RepID=A0A166XE36_9PEZI|nr:hypothetical protein CT0861_05712 [Colletotrichum tofieldiae]GKT66429.1 hypothetical protein ColTof3_13768 [Colletotrichum tofieldiae]GKT71498.1 hypothetical protein ColTof4_03921 [Colletotrichum tofieldiae]GKT95347.1 hypothetical protein Ct61P_13197 [Colletotrichum tofieldiae]